MIHRHRSAGPSRCQLNNCQCSCHGPYSNFGIVVEISSVLLVILTIFFFIITLVNWVGSNTTLLHTLKEEWHFVVDLAHRIY